jgi:hypothetical protein
MILLARLPEGAARYWWSGRAAGVLRTRSATLCPTVARTEVR